MDRIVVSSRTDFSRRLIRCSRYRRRSVDQAGVTRNVANAWPRSPRFLSPRPRVPFPRMDGKERENSRSRFRVSNESNARPPADLGRQPDLRVSSTSTRSLPRSRIRDSTFEPPVESQGTRPGDLSRSIRCTSIDFTAKRSRFYNDFDFVPVLSQSFPFAPSFSASRARFYFSFLFSSASSR